MAVFKPLEKDLDFPTAEKKCLEFWKNKKIFQKQLEQGKIRAQKENKSTYVFYEGPPTANGLPHPGHVLTRVVKDLFPRFKAMQGYNVPRKAGWDTHGLPVEIEVEKELGIEGKKAIEDYGVEEFIKKCRNSVFKYADVWKKLTERIGFWVDLDNPYVTYHESYIDSVWWSLKHLWDAGLLYHGAKIVPWCPRCGTALSSHEVGQGYKEVADLSAYVTFKNKNNPQLSYLAWTTTPWTLLSNVALAVGKDFDYDYVKIGDETIILASALREKVLAKIEHEVIKTCKGSDLVGQEYEQLFNFAKPNKPAFKVVAGDFVSLDSGSGIVHIAPAFGEDDYQVGIKYNLPMINLVNPDGSFMEEVTPWAGKFVKEADSLIIKELKNRNQLLKSEQYLHDYPFCWRCPSPLLYYPRPAWYIKTSMFKDKMLENNEQITWLPDYIKNGRFGNFLANNVDWALSRERYWGTPLPIWNCSCGNQIAIGSKDELLGKAENKNELPDDFNLHKPWVDQVAIKCTKCGNSMQRVSEVIDCWYDSGAMPFAQWGYPYLTESHKQLSDALPADFISEAIDQTRGWFYSLLAIATLLKECAKIKQNKGECLGDLEPWLKDFPIPYKKCLVLGLLLSQEGVKLSKKLRNYPDPFDVLESAGADALRWFFYISNQPWTSTRFFEGGIREAQKEYLVRLRNIYSFFVIYANIDGFDPRQGNQNLKSFAELNKSATYVKPDDRSLLDNWMLSKLETASLNVTSSLEKMDILTAAQALNNLVEQLSNWFVRRSRDRFWQSDKNTEKWSAYWTLYECLLRISVLTAPFTPFFAEELYQGLARDLWQNTLPESIHLQPWFEANKNLVKKEIEEKMDLVREIASLGLSARAAQKIKVRQPLSKAIVILTDLEKQKNIEELETIITEEINVKELVFAHKAEDYVMFNVKPNFSLLGPKLGKNMKACAAAIAQEKPEKIIVELRNNGKYLAKFAGQDLEMTSQDLEVRLTAKTGFAAADGKGAVVILDTTITDELEREGIAREIINRIQSIRKELDLAYEARIKVTIVTAGKVARAAIQFSDIISSETLASEYKVEAGEIIATHDFELFGESVKLSIEC